MTSLRAFIAVEIPSSIQQAIFACTDELQRMFGSSLVRWVAVKNLHLTLKFLGDVSPANVNMLSDMLTTEAAHTAPFSLHISGLGSYPTPRRARVIWVGINAPAALLALQRGIESASARLGYETEERSFSPHLTIGRVKQPLSAADQQTVRLALERTQVGDIGEVEVDAVHLFKSDLKPSGSVYTRLVSAPLKS